MKNTWHTGLSFLFLIGIGACTAPTVVGGREDIDAPSSSLPKDMVSTLLNAQQVGVQGNGDAACVTCGEAISGAYGSLCTENGPPSSAQLLDDLVACVCTNGCAAECGDACAGTAETATDACMTCIENTCIGAIDTCSADGPSTPQPPADPPAPASCSTCNEYLTGESSEAPCADDGSPSSADLYNDVIGCVCTTGCATECGNACNGTEDATEACYNCIYTTCNGSLEACTGTPVDPAPPSPPPSNSCATCNDFITGHTSDPLCTDDGSPSSADLYNDVIDCICTTGCATECGNACNGTEDATEACYNCIYTTCNGSLEACTGTPVDPAPPSPPPSNSCATCNDFITGHTSDSLCTDDGPPSSADVYNDVIDCICTTGCATECGNACLGVEDISDACSNCIYSTCDLQLQACLDN